METYKNSMRLVRFWLCVLATYFMFTLNASAQTMTVTAQLQGTSVVLNWSAVAGTTYYLIERNGRTIHSGSNTITTYTDTALQLGQSYSYVVHPVGSTGTSSGKSNSVSVTVGGFNYATQAPSDFQYNLASLNIPNLANLESVAITQGNASVNNGTLGYKVAIEAPPGVNNNVPTLAISYNSNAGNGIAGVGWNLSGLSAISRCAPTVATDGTGVSDPNTNKDDLCLDGQRLVLKGYTNNIGVSRSTYWASGTTYVTEQANFTEITSQGYGALSGEPNSFIAKTKDGKTLYFGEANRNAKVFAADDPIKGTKSWHLTRVSDRYGNEYTVDYHYDITSGEHLPSQILYAPGAAVVFNYVQRLGQIPWGSKNGKKYRQPNVLKSIDTYINVTNSQYPRGGTPVRRYNLEYKLSPNTGRDLVSTIQECGWVAQWNCAKPLTFNYEPGSFVGQEFPSPTTTTGSYPQYTDIDGDEYNDALADDGSVYWGQANGQFSSEDWSASVVESYWDSQVAPIRTKDGIAIVVRKIKSALLDSAGNVFDSTGAVGGFIVTSGAPLSLREGPTTQSISVIHSINRANHSKEVTKLGSSTGQDDPYTVGAFTIGDYDCDGLDDMYYKGKLYTQAVNGHPSTWVLGNSTYASPSMYMANTAGPCSAKKPVFTSNKGLKVDGISVIKPSMVDLNGDGNKELISHHSSTFNKIYRVGGDGFSMEGEQALSGGNAATLNRDCFSFTYDLDEDGREDILGVSPTSGFSAFLARDNGGSQAFLSTPISLNYFAGLTDIIDSCTENIDIRSSDIVVGDINSDGRPDLMGRNSFMSYPKKSDMLVQVTNGFGAETLLTYSTLSKDIYSPSSVKPQFPYAPASRGMWVVKSIATTNGKGGYNTQSYRYKGAVTHLQGRGFAGFEQITVTDEAKGLVNETNYHQQWPKTGKVSQQLVKDTSNKLISLQNTQYTSITGNGEFVYSRLQTQKTYGLLTTSVGSPISTKVIENQIDSCGNPEWQSQRVGGNYSNGVLSGELSRIDTAYVLDAGQANTCTDDFIDQTYVTYTAGGETRLVQTGFTPNAQGDVATRTDYQGTALEKQTSIHRTASGATQVITEYAKDIDSIPAAVRQTTFSNFEANAWPRTATNALNQSTQFTYDPRFGSVHTQTDSFVNTTTYYDELGRVTSLKTKDNTLTENISFYCASNPAITCPAGAVYGVATRITNSSAAGYLGAPLSIVFYDVLQREVQSSVYGFDNNVTNKSIEYMANGRVARVSEPFRTYGVQANVAIDTMWTEYGTYDALGRLESMRKPTGSWINTSYSQNGYGIQRTESTLIIGTNGPLSTQTRDTYTNALGQVTRAADAIGGWVDYTYDAQGNLKTTRVNNNIATQVTLTHDIAGNKTYINDPDAKNIKFEYNGFGELRRQTWQPFLSQKKSLTFSYDRLGRKTQRVDNGPGLSGTYNWTYDQNNQLGMLTGRSGGGLVDSYSYNPNGQLESSSHTVDGKTYNLGYQYDAFGRLTRSTSPDNFVAIREYSAQGYQVRTQGNRYQYTNVLWALGKQQDDRGNFTHQLNGNGVVTRQTFDAASGHLTNIRSGRLGNASTLNNLNGDIQNLNYRYDSLGNLLYRESKRTDMNGTQLESLTETLTYDALNRLDTSTGTGTYRRNYDYDALGNLTFREDKASSSTRATNVNRDIGSLLYENVRNAGPHAVTAAGGKTYSYDLYGNMTQRGTETLTYDIFNKPTKITGATTSEFFYDADHQLYMQKVNGVFTIYLGNVEIIREGLTTITNTYVDGVAQHRFFNNGVNGGGAVYYYLHRDNLGSVEATSSSAGYYQNRMNFDAWGNRQNENWTRGTPTVNSLTKQGYTGHEQLDSHKLVHMQGRVYDPALGRFLSADLFVQSPHSTQSFNRYSYVSNNPLSRIDPTGYREEGSNGMSGDGTDYSNKGDEIVITAERCLYGTSCMGANEASNYAQDLQNWTERTQQSMPTGSFWVVPYVGLGVINEAFFQDAAKAVDATRNGDLVGAGVGVVLTVTKLKTLEKGVEVLKDSLKIGKVCCFVAGTLVLTANGEQPIETLQLGDLVYAKNPETGEKALKPVTHLFEKLRPIQELKVVSNSGEEKLIETTEDHPFFVIGKGWVHAAYLQTDDLIESEKSGSIKVISSEAVNRVTTTYNIEVADFHTYYATEFGLLVHNANCNLDISTGRTVPKSLEEKLAMEEVKSNPSGVTPSRMPPMNDTKNGLLAEDGWVKRAQNVNGVEVHYVENTKTGELIDFKFKD